MAEDTMPDWRTLMNCYEELALASKAMLAAALVADWNQVSTLERGCAGLIASMPAGDRAPPLPEPQRRRRFEIMRRILAEDAQIRAMTQPWLGNLERSLHPVGRGA